MSFQPPHLLPYDDYVANMSRLNPGQRKILMEVLHRLKTNQRFHFFISGGAGVGKSFLIKTLYQAINQYYRHLRGEQGNSIRALLCAFTGKAAYIINGMTLHSAFQLPVSQLSGPMAELSADVANTIRSKLQDLKVLIIDEISMVGQKLLQMVNIRLQQIFNNDLDFGGVDLITIGDFNQLPPIGDA